MTFEQFFQTATRFVETTRLVLRHEGEEADPTIHGIDGDHSTRLDLAPKPVEGAKSEVQSFLPAEARQSQLNHTGFPAAGTREQRTEIEIGREDRRAVLSRELEDPGVRRIPGPTEDQWRAS